MKLNLPNIEDNHGQLNSVYPCTLYLTFGVWIYLVPQYKPTSVLMLGYAGGTAAGLIRLFYGNVPITGVDLEKCPNYYDVNLVVADARKYIKTCEHFDTVIVDLYEEGERVVPKYVSERWFADALKKKANYIILHVSDDTDISAYKDLYKVKTLSLDNASGKARFHYFMVNDIPSLPIR